MRTALLVAVVLGAGFWPAFALLGLGWWSERRQRTGDVERQPDRGPGGVPGYAVVAVLLATLGAGLAGAVVSGWPGW